MSLPRAVLWDLDGTLVDSEPYWIAAEHEIVEAAGGTWSDELAHQLVGNDLIVSARFIRDNSPIQWEPDRIVEELLTRVTAQVRAHIPWRPGALELQSALVARGVPTALVTMSWRRLVTPVLESLPAGLRFDAVVTGDEVRRGKPDPEPYLTAAHLLGVPPDECIAIEDSPKGMRSAVAAGVPTIGVPNTVRLPPLLGAVQLLTLEDLTPEDLAAVVSRPPAPQPQ